MRIAVVSYSRRKIGGTEQNLDVVLPEFSRRGHDSIFAYVCDEPQSRDVIRTAHSTGLLNIGATGRLRALAAIRAFQPDVINVHGEIPPSLQSALPEIAPAAYSMHNYYGSCISGLKTFQFPIVQPCSRRFGAACLGLYFPRRCGGKSPVTMLRRFQTERERLRSLTKFDAVIVYSAHMEAECLRHGLHPERVYGLPYEVAARSHFTSSEIHTPLESEARLLFVGRMEKLKGGCKLIDALPMIRARLRRRVTLDLGGDGPDRPSWQARALSVMARDSAISINFHGWLDRPSVERHLALAHLLVVPSLWPEPFGKVGPEAAAFGVPVAAFAVGGISEWLTAGVNGFLAPGDPPTSSGLSEAVSKCLEDPELYLRLREGAVQSAQRFHLKGHVDHLLRLFQQICRDRREDSTKGVSRHARCGAM